MNESRSWWGSFPASLPELHFNKLKIHLIGGKCGLTCLSVEGGKIEWIEHLLELTKSMVNIATNVHIGADHASGLNLWYKGY